MTVRRKSAKSQGSGPTLMSKEAYLIGADDHNLAHLTFYASPVDGMVWGADLPKSR